MMSRRFADKTVVITGASSGIGAAAAKHFAAEGAKVVLVARSADGLQKVAEEIGKGTTSLVVPTDVTDTESVAVLLERAEKHFGAIHVLVNNAGCTFRGPVEEKQSSDLARIVDVNLKAPIVLCRLAVPYLRRAGRGAIVNVASLAGRIPLAEEATYSATKFGLRAFSFALADELRGSGITVSVVSPGPVDTGFLSDIDGIPDVVFSQPMHSAEEVASVILDCAQEGQLERAMPRVSGYVTTFGYLFPKLTRVLKPLFELKGHWVKARYRARKAGS